MEETAEYIEPQTEQEPDPQPAPKKYKVVEFAARIKAKYPEYKDMDDKELTDKIIAKYPEYKEHVDFTVEPLKKKVASNVGVKPLANGSLPTQTVDGLSFLNPNALPEIKNYQPKDNTNNVQPNITAQHIDYIQNNAVRKEKHEKLVEDAIKNTAEKYLKNQGVIVTDEDKKGTDKTFVQGKPFGDKEVVSKNSTLYNQTVNKYRDAFQKGEATFAINKDGEVGLKRTIGTLEGLTKGWNNATTASDDAHKFVHEMDDKQRVEFLEQKMPEIKNPEYLGEQGSAGGSTAQYLAEQAPFLGKAVLGYGLGAAMTASGVGAPGLPVAMSFLATGTEMGNHGAMEEVQRRYGILRHDNPNGDKVEQMHEASKGALLGAAAGIATNALLMGEGGTAAKNIAKDEISNEGKSVIKNVIKNVYKSSVHMANVSAGVEGTKQMIGAMEGVHTIPSDVAKDMAEKWGENAKAGVLLVGLTHGLPKVVESGFKYVLSEFKPTEIKETLKQNEDAGIIPQGSTEKITAELDKYNEALAQVPKGLSPEAQASMAGLIEKQNALIEQQKGKHKVANADLDIKIKAIDEQIKKINETGKPFTAEIDEMSGEKYTERKPEEISQPIELKPYDTSKEILTDLEQKAIEGFKDFDTKGKEGFTKILTDILKDENATPEDKKQALQELKEQLSDPESEVPMGAALGKQADLIYDLIDAEKPKTESKEPSTVSGDEKDLLKDSTGVLTFYNGGGDINSKTGIYFTPNKELAKSFAEGKGAFREDVHGKFDESKKSKEVTEAKLVTKNPKKILYEGKEITPEEIEQYKKDGHDSVITYANGEIREVIVFDKSQIKNEETKTELPNTEETKEPTIEETNKDKQQSEEGGGKEPPVENVVEGFGTEGIGIIHAQTKELAGKHGFDAYETDPTTQQAWVDKAKERMKNGDMPQVLEKMQRGEEIGPVEQKMMGLHIANLDAEVSKNPTNENLSALKNAVALSDVVGGRQAGQSLAARKGTFLPDDTLGSWLVQKMESLGVEKLTETQKVEIQKQFDAYEAKAKKSEELLAKANDEIARLKAENELKNTAKKSKPSKPKTKEEFIAQRFSLKEKLKQQIEDYKAEGMKLGIASDGGVKSFIITAKMAKTIGEIVTSHVAEVGANLKEVTKRTFEEIKDLFDGITERDIHDVIAGEYNEKLPPKSALQLNLKDVQDEAKLINKLEKLLTEGDTGNEKVQRERNKNIVELQGKIKSWKDENKGELSPTKRLQIIKKANEVATKKLEERITKGEFETEKKIPFNENAALRKANPQLYRETYDAIVAKEEARNKFDLAKRQDELAKRGKAEKLRDFGAKLISTSKAIKAGIDDSVTFVQLGMAILANPKAGAKAKWEAIQDINAKRFKRELAALHQRPEWETIKNSGLDITEPKSHTEAKHEELYSGNLLDVDINVKGKTVNPWTYTGGIFERLFTSMGNNMRLNMFLKRMEVLRDEGKTFESHPKEYKDAARVINELTGRGKLNEHVASAMPVITPVLWAPKMLASTMNLLGISDIASYAGMSKVGTKGLYRELTPAQRKYAYGQMGKGIGMGVAVMAALAMNGWTVDRDPRSSTFGNVKNGTTSYNVFGRYAGFVKMIMQTVTGTKKTSFGEKDLDKKGGRAQVIGKFMRGKMTPFAGEAYDYIFNSQTNTFTKQPINLESLPKDLLSPISVTDLQKGLEQDGTMSLLTRWLPAVEGIQVMDDRDFDRIIPFERGTKGYDFMLEKNVGIVPHKKETLEPIDENGKPIEVTDEKYKEFLDKRQEIIKGELEKLFKGEKHFENGKREIEDTEGNTQEIPKFEKITPEMVADITPTELRSFIMRITEEANKKAVKSVFEGKQAPKEKPARKIQ